MRILTQKQVREIIGKKYDDHQYFHVVIDADADLVIGEEEVQSSVDRFNWLKELPKKDYKPVVFY